MALLRQQFPNELVFIGVHSAKFFAEQSLPMIRDALLRHEITHPVVNDPSHSIWQQYAIRAWPTVVLIDPAGYVVGTHAGEVLASDLAPLIAAQIAAFDEHGQLNRQPLDLRVEQLTSTGSLLRYPAKLLLADQTRLFVSDTGNQRVLELHLDQRAHKATVARTFGSGEAALRDGPAATAAFHGPRGLALRGDRLFVADTDNHAIRAINLGSGEVRTVAGTGSKAHGSLRLAAPTETALRSPWALLPAGEALLIAMAGSHQIWVLMENGQIGPFAGSGYEALVDGPRGEAAFNQPSDMAYAGGFLFIADAEASAIRAINLVDQHQVMTLIGQGLFEFGDIDGTGEMVRLQHPTGIACTIDNEAHIPIIYVADSYNHKIKQLDPTTGSVITLIGSGHAGASDGPFATAELHLPEGLAVADGRIFIADTNNHLVRVANLRSQELWTLAID